MSDLIHYCIVRKDLPLGVLAAQLTHAAGESAAKYSSLYGGRFKGSTAVVLGVKDEQELFSISKLLQTNDVEFVPVVESEGKYAQQLTTIGVVPTDECKLRKLFKGYSVLTTLDNPSLPPVSSSNATS